MWDLTILVINIDLYINIYYILKYGPRIINTIDKSNFIYLLYIFVKLF